jgi:hypothetical protein
MLICACYNLKFTKNNKVSKDPRAGSEPIILKCINLIIYLQTRHKKEIMLLKV